MFVKKKVKNKINKVSKALKKASNTHAKQAKTLETLNLKKEKSYKGILKGIKGQYLIFDDQTVFNIRSNEGLVVNFKIH